MTHTTRYLALVGSMTAVFCLATLAPPASNEAGAQGIQGSGSSFGGYSGYRNTYDRYGYGRNRSGNYVYTGNGFGPYGYGSSAPSYGYATWTGRVYRPGTTTYSLQYRAARLHGHAYRPIDNLNYSSSIYGPYGDGW